MKDFCITFNTMSHRNMSSYVRTYNSIDAINALMHYQSTIKEDDVIEILEICAREIPTGCAYIDDSCKLIGG
jgi:hypothetical protein